MLARRHNEGAADRNQVRERPRALRHVLAERENERRVVRIRPFRKELVGVAHRSEGFHHPRRLWILPDIALRFEALEFQDLLLQGRDLGLGFDSAVSLFFPLELQLPPRGIRDRAVIRCARQKLLEAALTKRIRQRLRLGRGGPCAEPTELVPPRFALLNRVTRTRLGQSQGLLDARGRDVVADTLHSAKRPLVGIDSVYALEVGHVFPIGNGDHASPLDRTCRGSLERGRRWEGAQRRAFHRRRRGLRLRSGKPCRRSLRLGSRTRRISSRRCEGTCGGMRSQGR